MNKTKQQNSVENAPDTATRILDAAEILFAEKGFNGTSARDITALAKCNVASISYYFQGKDNLYLQVCRRRLKYLRDIRVNSINDYMASDSQKDLEGLLTVFSESFLKPLLEDPVGKTIMKLHIREMTYPKLPANMIFKELFVPIKTAFVSALGEICPELTQQQLLWSMHSLIAQLLHIVQIQSIVTNSSVQFAHIHDIDMAVKHIVSFTAGGIRSFLD